MIIYTESDYLEAHLTEIPSEADSRSISTESFPRYLTDVVKKFTSATSNSTPPSVSRPVKSRNT